jgi:hypothetical protein
MQDLVVDFRTGEEGWAMEYHAVPPSPHPPAIQWILKLKLKLLCCVNLCCMSLKGALSVSERVSVEDHWAQCSTSTLSARSRYIQLILLIPEAVSRTLSEAPSSSLASLYLHA